MGKLSDALQVEREHHKAEVREQQQTSLKEKIAAVNQKIKNGDKLTTDDLLLLQNAQNDTL